MKNAILFQYFKDEGIPLDEVADKTGYSLMYLFNMLKGYEPLNDRAKFRILLAYPDLNEILLAADTAVPA